MQLKTTRALVETRRQELKPLESALDAEQADVRRLEQTSLTKVWATLRGDATERLALERAEADAALLAVTAAQARLKSALAEDARVRREHDALRGSDDAYRDALSAHEAAVHASAGAAAAALSQLAVELGVAEARRREIAEAVEALRAARSALDEALSKLDSAGGWSTYDTFFGGGLVADMVKHSRIDEATDAFVRVNRALERLSVELTDVGIAALEGVEISDMLAVFDVLFDNILSDWMVRDRISQAQAKAKDLSQLLDDLAGELTTQANDASDRIATLHARRESILTAV